MRFMPWSVTASSWQRVVQVDHYTCLSQMDQRATVVPAVQHHQDGKLLFADWWHRLATEAGVQVSAEAQPRLPAAE